MTLRVAREISWQEPWQALSQEQAALAEVELRREVHASHPLSGRPAKALGRRQDCDDFLFFLPEDGPCLVVVHLTYKKETSAQWPYWVRFESLADWVEECMLRDAADFV